jgi:hypothetical protein
MDVLDNQISDLVRMLKLFIEANDIMYVKGETNYEVLYILLRAKYGSEADVDSIIYNLLVQNNEND